MSITDQNAVMDTLVRHGAYLHRLSSSVVNEVLRHLDKAAPEFTNELRDRLESLTPAEAAAFAAGRITTPRLKGIENLIREFIDAFAANLNDVFIPAAKELVQHEVGYTADALAKSGSEGERPSAGATFRNAIAAPVAGVTIQETLKELPRTLDKRIRSTVRQGLADGQTASDIATSIKGTAALKRKDGVIQNTRNAVDRDIRTARTHLASQANAEVYQALGVRKVVWTSTLDGRTCKTCANLDGQTFTVGTRHRQPPAHPNCRCILAPKLADDAVGERPYVRAEKVKGEFRGIGKMTKRQREKAGLEVGQVKASVKFPEWLKTQDDDFARDWLGPKRFKLWKEGGYKLDRFVDPRGATLTIDQLRQKDRETFDRLFSA